MSSCKQCGVNFQITTADQAFYQSWLVPSPQLCPQCRQQSRFAWRNERSLYHSNCAVCQRSIVTIYAPEKNYLVYCSECWWGEKYDAASTGQAFDFSKTVAEQVQQLYQRMPHVALYTTNCTNSEFNNFGLNLNNCYLLFGASNDENCLYGKFVISSIDTVDALSVFSTELCYEAVASERCYHCRYLTNSRDCHDCLMIEDCQACSDCIGCFGLHSKQYYVFNQPVSRTEYEKLKQSYSVLTTEKINELQSKFTTLKKTLPHRAGHVYASEHCTGDLILNSVNCQHCFDIKESENCHYVYNAPKAKDSQDCVFASPYGLEHCYNCCSTTGARDTISSFMVWNSYNVGYSLECHQSHDLLACVGLQKKSFCILNTAYSPADYQVLKTKIIEHMKTTGEWGEFLSPTISPFGYNETIAQEYYPLPKAAAVKLGYSWYDEPNKQYQPQTYQVPSHITEVGDDILQQILACQGCQKNYKIIPQELDFYRRLGLPIPHDCPDCRRTERIIRRGPTQLWSRPCSLCQKLITTYYSADRAAIVYCEDCYRKKMY
ncbi:MAG: zinc-ribbon domain containing protein [Candidatus Kerfeldbacteria bacterium]|nr:zinc-ribbon domain containing protein [Candidatus Kerfeldbacteria bacterium]